MAQYTQSIPSRPKVKLGNKFHTSKAPLIHSGRTIETKPRLGKDEVATLEREFRRNSKPSTETKIAYATQMKVDLPRINNWFQNRRAKRRQERIEREEKALIEISPQNPAEAAHVQCLNPLTSESLTNSIDTVATGTSHPLQYFSNLSIESNNALLGTNHHMYITTTPITSQYPTEDGETSFTLENAFMPEDVDSNSSNQFVETLSYGFDHTSFKDTVSYLTTQLVPKSHPIINVGDQGTSTDSTQLMFGENNLHSQSPASIQSPMEFIGLENNQDLLREEQLGRTIDECTNSNFIDGTVPTGSGHASFTDSLENTICNAGTTLYNQGPLPAPVDVPFISRPPSNIASRRKKVQQRPAALIPDTIDGHGTVGPRTASQVERFHRPRESPLASPMRRIVSAGGNRAVASGRVQKPGSELSQRSPISLGGFEKMSRYVENGHQNFRNCPSLSCASPQSSSFAPLTPLSVKDMSLVNWESANSTLSPTVMSPDNNFAVNGTNTFVSLEAGNQNLASPVSCYFHPLAQTPRDYNFGSEFSEKSTFAGQNDGFFNTYQTSPFVYPLGQSPLPVFAPQLNADLFAYELSLNTPTGPEVSIQSGNEKLTVDNCYHPPKPATLKAKFNKTFQFSHTTPADYEK
ncbi:BgTH12-07256 [Blumeria graminis f. sp. triticale]|uniref:BgTH12-07256 n=1 Tax=Blumeria graminis f. sp. triticale TaxID=1689686 RepID=A0A9W4GJW9_BLUGR|nr:BgTH12-07256 [Blumeria graminis f. sp. triticale]